MVVLIVQSVPTVYRRNPAVKQSLSCFPSPERKKGRSPSSWESGPDKTLPSSLSYTSSGDSQRKDTMLNFLPNALFTALSSVSSKAPLFMLIFLTGVSGLFTGST